MDLLCPDPVTRRSWDLSKPKQVQWARHLIKRDRPMVLVLSPPELPEKRALGCKLFEVAVELCLLQTTLGGKFVLEHSCSSPAWARSSICKLLPVDGLVRTDFDMCAHGQSRALVTFLSA